MPTSVTSTKRDIWGGLVVTKSFPFFEKFMRAQAAMRGAIGNIGKQAMNPSGGHPGGMPQLPNPNPGFDPGRGTGGGAPAMPPGVGTASSLSAPPVGGAKTGGGAKMGGGSMPQFNLPRMF